MTPLRQSGADVVTARTLRARRGAPASGVVDLEDLEVAGAARGVDLDAVARLLAEEGLGQRRLDREQAGLDVGLLGADDLVAGLLVRLLVDQLDLGAEHDLRAGEAVDVDDLGPAQLFLELGDAALDETLPLSGGVILRVLREVAVLAGGRDRVDDGRA